MSTPLRSRGSRGATAEEIIQATAMTHAQTAIRTGSDARGVDMGLTIPHRWAARDRKDHRRVPRQEHLAQARGQQPDRSRSSIPAPLVATELACAGAVSLDDKLLLRSLPGNRGGRGGPSADFLVSGDCRAANPRRYWWTCGQQKVTRAACLARLRQSACADRASVQRERGRVRRRDLRKCRGSRRVRGGHRLSEPRGPRADRGGRIRRLPPEADRSRDLRRQDRATPTRNRTTTSNWRWQSRA